MTDLTPEQQFADALAAFQSEIPHIAKGQKANAGNYSYSYADLTDITQEALPLLAKHGLAWTAKPTISEGGFVLAYTLMHTAGHREEGLFPLPDPSKFSAQQIGSWLTYARRYALCAVTGIAPGGDDDDAVKAGDARAADPIPRAPRTRGATTRHKPDGPDPDDPWASDAPEPERVTDAAWIDGFRQRVTAATTVRDLQVLQGEANHMWGEHKLSREDAQQLRAEVEQRTRELKGAA
jgi:hypothetical protein